MIAIRASSATFVLAALLSAASAGAQDGPVSAALSTGSCLTDASQPSCASPATVPRVSVPAEQPRGDTPGTFTLFGNVKGLASSQTGIASTTANFGGTWRLKAGIRFDAPGGVEFTASAIGRRGYSLPVALAQPLGSDVQPIGDSNATLLFGAAPVHWDTELRIRKMFMASDSLDLGVVGEAFNLLNLNRSAEPAVTTPMLTSPTVRAGVFLGF